MLNDTSISCTLCPPETSFRKQNSSQNCPCLDKYYDIKQVNCVKNPYKNQILTNLTILKNMFFSYKIYPSIFVDECPLNICSNRQIQALLPKNPHKITNNINDLLEVTEKL